MHLRESDLVVSQVTSQGKHACLATPVATATSVSLGQSVISTRWECASSSLVSCCLSSSCGIALMVKEVGMHAD